MGIGILINYLDRVSLSVAAPQLQTAFHIGPAQLGILFSAFFWSYSLCQLPVGMLLDRLGTVRTGRWSGLLWGVASAASAAAGGYVGLIAARMLLGVAEAPSFSVAAKVTGYWFPRNERSFATALFDAAAKFSNVIGVPVVAILVVIAGWRWGFAVLAGLNFLYFIAFFCLYRDPGDDVGLSPAEYAYITQGGATREGQAPGSSMALLRYVIRQPRVWGLTLGFAAYGYVFYFFLTWLPSYLVHTMHMTLLGSAGYASIPWMAATCTDLFVGGWLIDALITRGYRESHVRKTVLVGGLVLGLAVVGAAQTQDARTAIIWISVSLSGLAAAAPVFWSLPSLIAPKGGVGTLSGIMNLGNNLLGAAAPAITGFIVGTTNSFALAFSLAGIVLVLGIACFLTLLGPIESIADMN
ncbi:MAG TPA: MFS transporter [Steroidobacteraceae bacterium]|jgi:sugar phosphate permease